MNVHAGKPSQDVKLHASYVGAYGVLFLAIGIVATIFTYQAGREAAEKASGQPIYYVFFTAITCSGLFLIYRGITKHSSVLILSHWLNDNADAIVTAFIMALVIKCFCIDVFQIPTSSMEPTLYGDSREKGTTGDKIMVTKFTYPFASIQRYDVIVFRFPLQQSKHFIKRVVGLPDERIVIHNGDIYTSKSGDKEFQITRKPLHVQESVWFGMAEHPDLLKNREVFDSYWNVTEGRDAMTFSDGQLEPHEDGKVQIEYRGSTQSSGGEPLNDMKASFVVTPLQGEGYLQVAFSNTFGSFLLHLVPGREGLVTYDNRREVKRFPLKSGLLRFNRPHRIDFALFDGSILLKINGAVELHQPFVTAKIEDGSVPQSRTQIALVSSHLALKMTSLSLLRDIHYEGGDRSFQSTHLKGGEILAIGPHQYFVLGDNVQNSHDGRKWEQWEYRFKDGRSILCESINEERNERGGFDHFVKEDIYGMAWKFYNRDLVSPEPIKTPFRFVDERFVVGKAFWVWLPSGLKPLNPETWNFRLIR